MQLQLIPSPQGQPDYLMAVVQFTHKGVYYKGSVIEDLTYGGDNTGVYLVSLVCRFGTYNLMLPVCEEPASIAQIRVADNTGTHTDDSSITIEELLADYQEEETPGKEFEFTSSGFSLFEELKALIREELTRIGR